MILPLPHSVDPLGAQSCFFFFFKKMGIQLLVENSPSKILILSSLKELLLPPGPHSRVCGLPEFPLDLHGTDHGKKNYSLWPLP